MKMKFSKSFEKSVRQLSGKILISVRRVVQEVVDTKRIEEISDCKKLADFESVYRIRISNLRVFFIYIDKTENGTISFQYLVSRGEAYNKRIKESLREKDQR